jgi:flavin-dependent dehydrogenase
MGTWRQQGRSADRVEGVPSVARIVVMGGGVVALGSAMLLAGDGHEVIVLERDPAPPPDDPADAWERWERPGLNQFRLPHAFLGGFRAVLEAELPEVAKDLESAGALRLNLIRDVMPEAMTGGWRDGDERYEWLTGRRPVMEAAVARAAEATPGVEVRRGTAAGGLISENGVLPGVPQVTGVRTRAGEAIRADLVVDMTGRRSSLPDWLAEIGARRPVEELEDTGFVYYGRHFRSADGSIPPMMGPPQIPWGTVVSLTLPADNGTWSVVLATAANDKALRPLRELDRWEETVRALPLVAHWLDGTPIDDGVQVLARLEDRYRGFVVDGTPVATGVVAVADSWACTNPTHGRGASVGMLHALTLRDQLRTVGLNDPAAFAEAFHAATARIVEPWYRITNATDRHQIGEIAAGISGGTYDPPDPEYELDRALETAGGQDPDCLRANLDVRLVLRTPDQVLADPELRAKVLRLGSGQRERLDLGPDRAQLVALAGAS